MSKLSALPLLAFLCFSLLGNHLACQSQYLDSLQAERNKKDVEFQGDSSPLDPKDRADFEGLSYFPIDTNYLVQARVVLTPDSLPFEMLTSTSRKPIYRQWAWVYFSLNDSLLKLAVYENEAIQKKPGMSDYRFIPFTDLTNGFETYGGGRYLELRATEEDEVVQLDFNSVYNPYCAYSDRFSCPIPPACNALPIELKAGEKKFDLH